MGKHHPCVKGEDLFNGRKDALQREMLSNTKEKNIGVLYESVINIGLSCFGLSQK
jgi:hypothetical protein